MSSEAAVIRNYLDWIANLPWKVYNTLNKNIKKAEEVLNQDHFGLDKIKERITEYLAVNLRTNKLKSPILCLIGPPGVGKTSLVRSIARATGREFVKVSLGGLRDEAEIKGHRRTYIGSMPGKILQAMKKAKKSNPVILLDEIDKMGFDYRGDPSSALLEVLDPEQNHIFNDHYLELDYDLSNVMFVATANGYEGIPRPLMDRMEIISLSGYTEQEKVAIAINHLLPKQREAHGLKTDEIIIDEDAVLEIIRYYTREAGVRSLDRNIAKVARKVVKQLMVENLKSMHVTKKKLRDYLGVKKYDYGEIEKRNLIGIANGLAYSEVGGDLLAIESVLTYGKGEIKRTGKLGDVMKESIEAASSYIKSKAPEFGIKPTILKNKDIHVHVPEGATPKDGPSAGVAMCTSIVSVLTGIPVRREVAMTGEISLRGRVLPIGGLKEKLLAALRGGVKTVLIPKENVKDLEEIPDNVKSALEIIPIEMVEEAINITLERKPKPIIWDEREELKADLAQMVAH
jgi:ATP-dependent Lon protease